MKDILWDAVMLTEFNKLACLSEDEQKVLMGWAKGWSLVKIADKTGMSERTVSRHIETIRRKYDAVCIYTPLLPRRK